MKILVFGATGRTGQELVRQALEHTHSVTAFTRNPSKFNFTHPGLSVVQGDVTNFAAVENAIKGHDAVFSTLGAASPFRFDQGVVDGIKNIVQAMERSEVKRLIYMSAINVGESRPNAGIMIRILAPILLRTETAGHEARESIIRKSALDWTMVRSAGLNNGPHTGLYRSGNDIRAKGAAAGISRADVADFLLRQLTDKSNLRKTPMVMY